MVKRNTQEETWNVATHLLRALLALVGLVWICFQLKGNLAAPTSVACVVYAVLLVMMYVMSTLSHWFQDSEYQARFRAYDQAFIFLLIVGTYTPLSIHFWDTTIANVLLVVMWSIAIAGFVAKIFFSHRVDRVSIIGYVVLGWMPILGMPFHDHLPVEAMWWVFAGGIVYTLGTLFLINDRKAKWCHPVWHLCVVLASAIHFAAVVKFVVLD